MAKVPYKIQLSEQEIPKYWYNVRADMQTDCSPILNPGTGKPVTVEDLAPVFCEDVPPFSSDSGIPPGKGA